MSGLRAAQRRGGILVPVGDGRARMQVSYAGNVAWAHLCAVRCLAVDPPVDLPVDIHVDLPVDLPVRRALPRR